MINEQRKPSVSRQTTVVPTDEEIIQANVARILSSPNKLYDHRRGKLDAVGVIEVAISERMETIKHYRAVYGKQICATSRDEVAKLRHEAGLMEEAIRRLRALGVTTDSPLASQLRNERENPLPTMGELIAPAAKLFSAETLPRQVRALLDTEKLLPGVNAGKIRPDLIKIAVVTKRTDGPLNLSLTAGWGHAGQNGVTMPGKGRLETRAFTAKEVAGGTPGSPLPAADGNEGDRVGEERRARSDAPYQDLLGPATHDIFLNESACWRNVPEKVWNYTIGGYQVIKKWLSYREHDLLGRPLTPDEAREVTHMARRIAALILLQPALDQNYEACKSASVPLKP